MATHRRKEDIFVSGPPQEKVQAHETERSATYQGICFFYSETGTEGGYWAFLDERLMHLPSAIEKCEKCDHYAYKPEGELGLGKSYDDRNDLAAHQEWIDRWEAEREQRDLDNKKLSEEFGISVSSQRPCEPGKHNWVLAYPDGIRSLVGMHLLADGDYLTVYSPANKEEIVWQGEISLQSFDSYTQSAAGFWVHSNQKGVNRNIWVRWFLKEFPAELKPASTKVRS